MSLSIQSQKRLSSFCQNHYSFKLRIALSTFHNIQYSQSTEKIILLWEHLQLISLIFFLNFQLDNDFNDTFLVKAIIYFFKLVNMSYLLDFTQSNTKAHAILCIIFWATIVKYILAIHIIVVEYWNKKRINSLFLIWRWVFKVQGRILAFFTTSFAVRTIITASTDSFHVLGMNKLAIIIISAFFIVFEYIFSLAIEMQFCEILPTTNFLSSKNNNTQILVLFQKMMVQIFMMSFQGNRKSDLWIFTISSLMISIVNNYHFYTRLPLYHCKALIFQGRLFCLVISFDISCFIYACLKQGEYSKANIHLVVLIWIILSLLTMKLCSLFLEKLYFILQRTFPSIETPEFLVHKVVMAQEIRIQARLPGEKSIKYDFTHLLFETEKIKLNNIFKTRSSSLKNQGLSLSKEEINQVYLFYLEELQHKFPHNSFLKLQIANLCSNHPTLYTRAIQHVSELGTNKYSHTYLNSLLLLHKIEKAIMYRHNLENTKLDISTFLQSQILIEELKKDLISQIRIKLKIYENITGDTADLGEIFNSGKLVNKSHTQIEKRIKTLLKVAPSHYTKPLLLCAEYKLILNYSLEEYEKFQELYARKRQKNEKYFQESSLNDETLYQEGNAFLLFSGEKLGSGKIVFWTKDLEKLFGGERKMFQGTSISNIFVPSLQNYYKEQFRRVIETDKKYSENKETQLIPTFLFHRKKYMIEAEVYVQIHPYITQNLYYDMIIRPTSSGKEHILLKENGDIESVTLNIAKIFRINSSKQIVNIKSLSEDLYKINEAFNLVNKNKLVKVHSLKENAQNRLPQGPFDMPLRSSTGQSSALSLHEALDLHSIFSSRGKDIILYSQSKQFSSLKSERSLSYHCKVKVIQTESSFVKLVTLGKSDIDKLREGRKKKTIHLQQEPLTLPNEQIEDYADDDDSMIPSENVQSLPRETEDISPEFQTNENINTARNLLSTFRDFEGINTNHITSPQNEKKELLPKSLVKSSQSDISEENGPNNSNKEEKRNTLFDNINYEPTKYIKEKKQQKAFQRLLALKQYSKTFNGWIALFYLVILITLFSQTILYYVSNTTMKNLAIKNSLLKNAQIVIYRTGLININAVGGYLQITGLAESSETVQDLSSIAVNFQNHLGFLINASKSIIEEIRLLDTDVKKRLFVDDVSVYGSPIDINDSSTQNMTQFQAVDEIIAATKTIISVISSPNLLKPKVTNLFNFIGLNTLDSIIYKNFETRDIFLELVNNEKSYFQIVISLCSTITPILLLGVGLMLIIIIRNQYKIEENYLFAFLKLDPIQVKRMSIFLKDFERRLLNDEFMKNNQAIQTFIQLNTLPENERISRIHKKEKMQVIKYSGILYKYKLYVIKVTLYISLLAALIVGDYISTKNSTDTIYRRQDQLQFANDLSNAVIVNYLTYSVLFSYNNTVQVNNKEALVAFIEQTVEVRNIQEKIPKAFQEKDKTYDPRIESVLLSNDECNKLQGSAIYYCNLIKQRFDQQTNLLSSIAIFEELTEKQIQRYIECDKSTIASILKASRIDQEVYLPMFVIIGGQAQLIAEIVDKNLSASIFSAERQRCIFLGLFSVSLLCVSLLIWFQILSKLREVDNDFKKVLQVFPSTLILSSFLLKTFLKKSSKGILNI